MQTIISTNLPDAALPELGSDTESAVGELLSLIARERASHLRRWCRQDVSMTAIHVLLAIEAHSPLTMSRLAEILDVAVSNATGIVTRMEERGLVQRMHDEADRRVVFVTSTERGRRVLEDREFMKAEQLRLVLGAMTARQRGTFVQALREFIATAERLRAEGSLVDDDADDPFARPDVPPTPAAI
jgi:DNA-binding MarR family transcriptional regulator